MCKGENQNDIGKQEAEYIRGLLLVILLCADTNILLQKLQAQVATYPGDAVDGRLDSGDRGGILLGIDVDAAIIIALLVFVLNYFHLGAANFQLTAVELVADLGRGTRWLVVESLAAVSLPTMAWPALVLM